MKTPSREEVEYLHRVALEFGGGLDGLRDEGALESAVAQPMMAFGGQELYPTLAEKTAALGYSLAMNHPFLDGNKRTAYVAMVAMLRLNGHVLKVSIDDAENTMLALAAGERSREQLTEWISAHTEAAPNSSD